GIVGLLCDGQVCGELPNGGHDVVYRRRREVRPHLGEVLYPRPGGGEEGVQRVPGGGVAVGVVALIPRASVGRELFGEGVEGGGLLWVARGADGGGGAAGNRPRIGPSAL